jgi:peptidyl-prolyl cis-trans isomerase D
MFEYIHNNRRIVQLFLALITLPFAFWGVESYVRNASGGSDVASIGSSKISQQELQQALREQQDRIRQQLGRELPAAMLDNPEMRRAALDSLINQRLLALHAIKSHLTVSDAQLSELIQTHPDFLEDGKFVRQRYDAFVASQNMSPAEFERRLRQDLSRQQMLAAVRDGAVAGHASADRWIAALLEEREITETLLKPEDFVAQVKLSADAAKTYYDANRKMFETPEQMRAEYLVLSQDALAAQVSISDQEIGSWYQSHADRYKQNEGRRASHILITAAKDAPDAAVKAAQAKAEEILALIRKAPGDFAKLARQYSQDPGSAAKGGDLDWFSRGMMVKPFDDVAFSLKENEISGIVRSDFGFHIIKLTGIKAEKAKPLEEVRAEIVDELKRQASAKKYAEVAESFSNIVYEQSDSLKPAAEKFKLTVQQSPWLAKGAAGNGPLAHPKLIAALFSDDAIKNKRNTEAVEVAPNTLIAAHVQEYKPAAQLPLEAVRADIEKRLMREEAAKLVKKEGEARLAKLGKDDADVTRWGTTTRSVTRSGAPGIAQDALHAIFAADVAKLPAYAGAALPDGSYALYRIAQIKPYLAAGEDNVRAKALRQQYARIVAEEEFSAWLATLRSQYSVEINKAVLERKDLQ